MYVRHVIIKYTDGQWNSFFCTARKGSIRMYHVECIDIHKGDPLYTYIDRASLCANNMYNAANFYIRNLMTGLKKDIRERTENESSVIDTVNGSISGVNIRLREKYDRKVRRIRETAGLSDGERADRIARVKHLQFYCLQHKARQALFSVLYGRQRQYGRAGTYAKTEAGEQTLQHPYHRPAARSRGQTGRSARGPILRDLSAPDRNGRRTEGRGHHP